VYLDPYMPMEKKYFYFYIVICNFLSLLFYFIFIRDSFSCIIIQLSGFRGINSELDVFRVHSLCTHFS
jgi:hypothetical protein